MIVGRRAPVERGHPPAWQCLGARARADGDALFEDRFHQRACHGEGVLVLREVFAQQLGDRGGLARIGIRDQRFIDRDLIVLASRTTGGRLGKATSARFAAARAA